MNTLFFANELSDEALRKRLLPRKHDDADTRGYYFRDTTAIIHSHPFRRLKHKTQVFFAPRNDHICTRMEHVMHVATIAATICRALQLDSDLAWAIGLGHDVGHAPFGHAGEVILSNIRSGSKGFRHEMYGLRVVDHLAGQGKGLNLCYAVRDGIINHCGEKFEQRLAPDHTVKDLTAITQRDHLPSTWEGVVVRMADKIAYLGRDLEDAIQMSIITADMIPKTCRDVLGVSNAQIINVLVRDIIREANTDNSGIGFSDTVYEAIKKLKDFNYEKIYRSKQVTHYEQYFERIIYTLYNYYVYLIDTYGIDIALYKNEENIVAERFREYISIMRPFYERDAGCDKDIAFDYVAGMTDTFAMESARKLMMLDA